MRNAAIVRRSIGSSAQIKKLLFLTGLLLPAIAQAEPVPPLLEIFRDEPNIQDSYILSDRGDHEEMAFSSNVFLLPRQEFGKYVRAPGDLSAQIDKLANSIVGTNFKRPKERTIVWPQWHVFIKGEEIDAGDPRFNAAFRLLGEQLVSKDWRPKDITAVKVGRAVNLQVSRLQYPDKRSAFSRPHVTRQIKNGLEVCDNMVGDHLVCHLRPGFMLLANPKH